MIQGERLRLHKGSCCRLKDCPDDFLDKMCSVAAYEKPPSVKGWRVKVQGMDAMSIIPEASLALRFHLLPQSLARLIKYALVEDEAAQGACGRGLIAAQDISARHPIFVEPPLIVVGGAQGNDSASFVAHENRWLAYKALLMRSSKGGAWQEALEAFDDLAVLDSVPDSVRAAAARIATKEGMDEGNEDFVKRIQDTLMRYKCNQFDFSRQTSTDLDAPEFASSAVYALTSRLNHSCTPNVVTSFKERVCRESGEPFDLTDDGGVLVISALRDIRKGEPLTHQYQQLPAEKLERRAMIEEKLCFSCKCDGCATEEGVEPLDEPVGMAATGEEAPTPRVASTTESTESGADEALTPHVTFPTDITDSIAARASAGVYVWSRQKRQMAVVAVVVAVAVTVALVSRRGRSSLRRS